MNAPTPIVRRMDVRGALEKLRIGWGCGETVVVKNKTKGRRSCASR